MPINSDVIRKKEFHIVFKGYKPEEVDKFLDSLSAEFEKLVLKNKEMQDHIERLKYDQSSESDEMKKVLQDALVSAHKIAEDIKQKAEMEAKEMYRQKKEESEKEFNQLEQKKQKMEEDIAHIKKQYLGLKQYLEDALKSMDAFDISSKPEQQPQEIQQEIEHKEEPQQETQEEDSKSVEESQQEEKKEEENAQGIDQEGQKEEHLEQEIKRKKIDIANPDIIDDFFKADGQ